MADREVRTRLSAGEKIGLYFGTLAFLGFLYLAPDLLDFAGRAVSSMGTWPTHVWIAFAIVVSVVFGGAFLVGGFVAWQVFSVGRKAIAIGEKFTKGR